MLGKLQAERQGAVDGEHDQGRRRLCRVSADGDAFQAGRPLPGRWPAEPRDAVDGLRRARLSRSMGDEDDAGTMPVQRSSFDQPHPCLTAPQLPPSRPPRFRPINTIPCKIELAMCRSTTSDKKSLAFKLLGNLFSAAGAAGLQ